MHAMPTAKEILDEAERRLKASPHIEHPHAGKERYDAEELLAFVFGLEADQTPLGSDEVTPVELRRFRGMVDRRSAGEPAAFITGRTTFRGLTLKVSRGAFIPRQSSEWMADQVVRRLRARRGRPVHVDLATGVGPVALSVAHDVARARVFGTDISARPLALARANARLLGLRNVRFVQGDLFSSLPGSVRGEVDVVSIHPPYVGTVEMRILPHEIKAFEPVEALTDRSPTGMRVVGKAAEEGRSWLRDGGWLMIEVSPDHSRTVATILRRAGYADVRSTKGEIAVSRVVVGRCGPNIDLHNH